MSLKTFRQFLKRRFGHVIAVHKEGMVMFYKNGIALADWINKWEYHWAGI
jgi:hypothetical protein